MRGRRIGTLVPLLIGLAQALLAIRVLARLARTARGQSIVTETALQPGRVSVVVPVLNERGRLAPCLEGLLMRPPEVLEVLVVDGGSVDGTQDLVQHYSARDVRIRLVDASPVPPDWTGKSWGLHVGFQHASAQADWLLCLDADVRPAPALTGSLLAHARRVGVSALSVATSQTLTDPLQALLHPALLTVLVYRFGIPGGATNDPGQVQANGQCFLVRRAVLARTDAFRAASASLCEDVTIARRLAECGERVGFYESDGLVDAAMYSNWHEAWDNWPRSLPMRDRYFGWRGAVGLAEVALVQAVPLILLAANRRLTRSPWWLVALNRVLLLVRLGVLAGTARAYPGRPWTYWLSPLLDAPVAFQLVRSALRTSHSWRGMLYVRAGRAQSLRADGVATRADARHSTLAWRRL
jgi:dolichol-phosphate mannosyltransferase